MKSIKLDRKTIRDGEYTDSDITINNNRLSFNSYDTGPLMQKYAPTSRDEYEYSASVEADELDNVLLELLKDRFTDANDFMKWLEVKGIKFEFYND